MGLFSLKRTNNIRDPVCGRVLSMEGPLYRTEAKGKSYSFCSPGCKSSFKRNIQARFEAEMQQRRLVLAAAREAAKSRNCDSCG